MTRRKRELPPGRDKACAGQLWQSGPPSPGLKAVETLGVCPWRSAEPCPLLFPVSHRGSSWEYDEYLWKM